MRCLNQSMQTSVHCTDIYFPTRCRLRYNVRSCIQTEGEEEEEEEEGRGEEEEEEGGGVGGGGGREEEGEE